MMQAIRYAKKQLWFQFSIKKM